MKAILDYFENTIMSLITLDRLLDLIAALALCKCIISSEITKFLYLLKKLLGS